MIVLAAAKGVCQKQEFHDKGTSAHAQINGKSTFIGLAILVCAGISYGVFSPAFNLASNDQVPAQQPKALRLRIFTLEFSCRDT